jgi:hypothetical protein
MRIESHKFQKGGICEVEFSRRVHHDIGKLSGAKPVEAIPLREGQTFGAFTAAIYDPQSNRLLVESGQACVRGSAIGDYVSGCSNVAGLGYGLNVVIREGIDPSSIRGKDCRKIEVIINSKKLTTQDRANAQGFLSSFFKIGDGLGGDRIRFEISCQRVKPKGKRKGKQGLTSALLMDIAEETYTMHRINPDAVQAKFTARDGESEPDDILTFLGMKLEYAEDIPAFTGNRRYPLTQKMEVLYRALDAWRDTF